MSCAMFTDTFTIKHTHTHTHTYNAVSLDVKQAALDVEFYDKLTNNKSEALRCITVTSTLAHGSQTFRGIHRMHTQGKSRTRRHTLWGRWAGSIKGASFPLSAEVLSLSHTPINALKIFSQGKLYLLCGRWFEAFMRIVKLRISFFFIILLFSL